MRISNINTPQPRTNFKGRYIISGSLKAVAEFERIAPKEFSIIKNDHRYLRLTPTFLDDNVVGAETLCMSGKDAIYFWYHSFTKYGPNFDNVYCQHSACSEKTLTKYWMAKERGDRNTEVNLFLWGFKKGRKLVSEIFGNDEKIKTVRADDAINAAQKGKFDFETGEILK